jgi:c-di-GMP-binding flagellar brake protein YcgR
MPILEHMAMKVEFKDPLFPEGVASRKVLDISAGGMAFVIAEEDTPLFPVGLTLEQFTFTIKNKKYVTRAEVSNVRKIRTEGRLQGYAVGVRFKDLRPGETQHIASFVFDESRKYFSKFL